MTFEQQYNFQYDLFNAMIPVVKKHFKEDAYGHKDDYYFESILIDLDVYKEWHDDMEYSDKDLRQSYMENPPKGLTKEKVKKMSKEELFNFEVNLQMEENEDTEFEDPFATIYANRKKK
jgi:hypothetical protein